MCNHRRQNKKFKPYYTRVWETNSFVVSFPVVARKCVSDHRDILRAETFDQKIRDRDGLGNHLSSSCELMAHFVGNTIR